MAIDAGPSNLDQRCARFPVHRFVPIGSGCNDVLDSYAKRAGKIDARRNAKELPGFEQFSIAFHEVGLFGPPHGDPVARSVHEELPITGILDHVARSTISPLGSYPGACNRPTRSLGPVHGVVNLLLLVR